jgi:hypothetical protein
MLVEQLLIRRASSAGIKLPRAASIFLALSVLLLTAHWGFFPPVETYTDIAPRVAQAVASNIEQLVGQLRGS